MRRSRSVLLLGFLVTLLTVTAIASFMVFVTVYKKPPVAPLQVDPAALAAPPADDDGDDLLLDHHRAHSKPGPFYEAIDLFDTGQAPIYLRGVNSHTHYIDEGPPVVVGKIVSFLWFDNFTHKVLGTKSEANVSFSVGDHVVGLTVVDNTRDTHTAYTKVVVKDSNFQGVYCYYYTGSALTSFSDEIDKGARPSAANSNSSIAFDSITDFPLRFRGTGANDKFIARCVFRLDLSNVTRLAFDAIGTARLTVNGTVVPGTAGAFNIPKGAYNSSCQLIYTSPGGGRAKLAYKSGLGTASEAARRFSYNFAKVLPVITALDPDTSTRKGGGRVVITGTSLNTVESVLFGGVEASIESKLEDGSSITVIVPNADQKNIPVETVVVVQNRNGRSNSVAFEFDDDTGAVPIKFEEVKVGFGPKTQRNIYFDRLTGIKYGPDHRYYATSLSSHVINFELDDDFKVVTEGDRRPCYSQSLGQDKKLLGLAFNYASANPRLYVASSVLFWEKKNILSGPKAWMNGVIHVMKKGASGPECLTEEAKIITGLPVSNADHGVNGMVFDDDGKLRIQVGGFTNAGMGRAELGGFDENPLSGASLIADVDASNFEGKITYTTSNPVTARQVIPPGKSTVEVYMAGFRNSFGINVHSNGKLYATDNGPSMEHGGKSTSCKDDVEFKSEDERYMLDKLHVVTKGKYGGHPNRNRGRNRPHECVYYSTEKDQPDENYQPPLAVLESSTPGVVEYVANSFHRRMKHNLVLTKFASQNSQGHTYRVTLDGDGTAIKGKPEKLLDKSGLAVEMTPHGGLIMTRVHLTDVIAFKPSWKTRRMMLINVMPNRGPSIGKNKVKITGLNIGPNPMAYFGDPRNNNKCTKVEIITPNSSFYCTVPPSSSPGIAVIVYLQSDVGGVRRTFPHTKDIPKHGTDYKYLKPAP